MKLPIVKTLSERFDEDYLLETLEVLEALAEVPTLKDKELEVVGELISNTLGAVEVIGIMRESNGRKSAKEASSEFMKRVLGSIDQ